MSSRFPPSRNRFKAASLLLQTRSVWEGHISKPKTTASKAPVPVIEALRQILDTYSLEHGNPQAGPMFKSQNGTPLNS